MTTYDLRQHDMTTEDLFRLASEDTIQVITKDGQTFVIERADDFEKEVALLRESDQFMAFLAERSRKKQGSISLDAFEREIEADLASEAAKTMNDSDEDQHREP
jgi:hypothetical protein